MIKKEYPITAEKMGLTDYTRAEFHKRITMSDYPFEKTPNMEGLKKYICQVGDCSGIETSPKKKK